MTDQEALLRAARAGRWPERSLPPHARPTTLPPSPWRYTLTPALVRSLVLAGEHVGELRALPISFLRRVDLTADARRARILGRTAQHFSSVTRPEVEAVLKGAVLPSRRRGIMDRIRNSAIVEDALDHYPRSGTFLTPELASAYVEALSPRFVTTKGVWMAFSGRQRKQLLDLLPASPGVHRDLPEVLSWIDADDIVASSPVLRAATTYWGMSMLGWYEAGVVAVHHQLRAGGYDPHGLVVGPVSAREMRALIARTPEVMADADRGDLTSYFEHFAKAYTWLARDRLFELGRVRDVEANLPWKIVAPPDALDARLVEVVGRLGQAGSAEITASLGARAPPMRTLQRRLGKLVEEGTIGRRGSRKTAVYFASGGGVVAEDKE